MPAAAARIRSRVADRGLPAPRARSRNDVYTVLLTLSLVAMAVASLLMWLDYKDYSAKSPASVPPSTITK